ncbi:4Fe-4S ferredoxin, iron-sulpur binding domain-containing protein [Alkalidesulfovibrio alkalitolerans DSM 16529]|jgi:molybdopterin-containing oxidoreductase family iron-sulfur binding subunit|uniref:4Fe-4S ferredoxin, iron-sulpur binding domain-containing protein n=1 Tax=Alkalidesulfovibrio alkalitolerans DSM 16529 TaxID=1121439 RepID=S7T6V8_9BACT|nr:4Fe-4S dicluster domain-containing protein [Alkalidesulfovibrio alkalitolerans]EPR32286.1 4Fe-4S ferredoxin, iron-sulpur binding domain-containing protein [Alkalidesulfovibrio alkalitolerans DSM 16529]
MPNYAMVIDLHRCTGCGGCIVACKNENNLPQGINWSYKRTETLGTYPNVRFFYRPTLCNHCENAPCVRGCPTRALHKTDGGITMHDPTKCIGCRYCQANCPYGVVKYNWRKPFGDWEKEQPLIPGCTSSASELNAKLGTTGVPWANMERGKYRPVRPTGVVEKCTFCHHRVVEGLLPYCVEACPADARIFGDLDDPNSKVNELLGNYKAERLREDLGTRPKVYYIRSFNAGTYERSKGGL